MARHGRSQHFWNKEYKEARHLSLSTNPSEDMMKFLRFLDREEYHVTRNDSVLDLGCGNGRNLIFLAKQIGMRGIGYDISNEAIKQAKAASEGFNLTYEARSISGPLNVPDESQTLVLDMMTSHFLDAAERKELASEITRVLKPGGWLYFKTFLLDEDKNAARLLKENPAEEKGSYIHPKIGVAEHVFTEDEIIALFPDHFTFHKTARSHRHKRKGGAGKRRSISVYAQKTH